MNHLFSAKSTGVFILFAAAVAASWLSLAGATAAEKGKYYPVSPEALFAFLPKPESGWKVTESAGESVYSMWVHSVVTRVYEGPVNPEQPDAPPAGMRIKVTDTGEYPGSIMLFANFQEGSVSDDLEKAVISSYPAFIYGPNSRKPYIRMLVNGRVIVEFHAEGLELRDVRPWLEASDFGVLNRLPEKQIDALPPVLELVKVDELKPDLNRKYRLHRTILPEEALQGTAPTPTPTPSTTEPTPTPSTPEPAP